MLFPLLLALLALCRTPRAPVTTEERVRNRWLMLSLIWIATAYFLFREHILKFEWNRQWISWAANPMVRSTGADRWLMPLVLMGRYAAVLVAPLNLSLDYGGDVIGSAVRYREPYFYLGIVAVAGWLVAFVALIRAGAFRPGRPGDLRVTIGSKLASPAAFVLLGLALTFGLVSNLTALIGTIFGERLAYMPSAFLSILAGLFVGAIISSARRRRWIAAGVLALVIAGSIRTVTYARQWNDATTLYRTTLAHQPKSFFLHALVYEDDKRLGDWQAAQAVAEDCRQQVPQWWQSWMICIEVAIHFDRLTEAQDLVRQAMHVCYNDGLIFLWDEIKERQAEKAETQPTQTQPAQTQPPNPAR